MSELNKRESRNLPVITVTKSTLLRVVISIACLALGSIALLTPRPAAGNRQTASHTVPWHWGGQSRGEDLVISLVSVGQGDSFFMLYGHSALLVEDRALKVARLYNYGVFTMEEENMLKYLKGRLFFQVRDFIPRFALKRYGDRDRDVRIAQLNLTPETRLELAGILAEDVKPENRSYLYDHYTANCATKIRDAVNEVLGGQLKNATVAAPGRMTRREHVRRHSTVDLFGELFAVYSNGMANDRPITVWEEMFLPIELERVFHQFVYVQDSQIGQQEPVPLLEPTKIMAESTRWAPLPPAPRSLVPGALLAGLALGLLICLLGVVSNNRGAPGAASAINRAGSPLAPGAVEVESGSGLPGKSITTRGVFSWVARRLLGLLHVGVALVVGVLGSILLFAACFTDHQFMYWNQNLFILSPVALVALVPGLVVLFGPGGPRLRGGWVWLRGVWFVQLLSFGLALLLFVLGRSVPVTDLYQDTSLFLALFGPIYPALYLTSFCGVKHQTRSAPAVGRAGPEQKHNQQPIGERDALK